MSTTQVILDINRLREETKLRIRLICVEIRTDFEKIRPILDGKVELTRVIATQSEELHELLNLLSKAGWLTYSEGDEPGAPLVVDFLKSDDFLPAAAPILFTAADQWVFWCETELNMRREVTGDPNNQGLFRRWCASNVTVTEMLQACEEAAPTNPQLTPSVLHAQLQTVRRARLEKARG